MRKESLKMEKLKKLVLENNLDLVCLTETNKDWRKIEYENIIWGTTTSWRENSRVLVCQNTSRPAESLVSD